MSMWPESDFDPDEIGGEIGGGGDSSPSGGGGNLYMLPRRTRSRRRKKKTELLNISNKKNIKREAIGNPIIIECQFSIRNDGRTDYSLKNRCIIQNLNKLAKPIRVNAYAIGKPVKRKDTYGYAIAILMLYPVQFYRIIKSKKGKVQSSKSTDANTPKNTKKPLKNTDAKESPSWMI